MLRKNSILELKCHMQYDMFKVDLGLILKWKGIELDGMSFWTT